MVNITNKIKSTVPVIPNNGDLFCPLVKVSVNNIKKLLPDFDLSFNFCFGLSLFRIYVCLVNKVG